MRTLQEGKPKAAKNNEKKAHTTAAKGASPHAHARPPPTPFTTREAHECNHVWEVHSSKDGTNSDGGARQMSAPTHPHLSIACPVRLRFQVVSAVGVCHRLSTTVPRLVLALSTVQPYAGDIRLRWHHHMSLAPFRLTGSSLPARLNSFLHGRPLDATVTPAGHFVSVPAAPTSVLETLRVPGTRYL